MSITNHRRRRAMPPEIKAEIRALKRDLKALDASLPAFVEDVVRRSGVEGLTSDQEMAELDAKAAEIAKLRRRLKALKHPRESRPAAPVVTKVAECRIGARSP